MSQQVLARVGPGEIFGEISFVEPGGAAASVVADSEMQLYIVEGPVLARLFEWKPQLAARFFLYIVTITEKRLRQSEALLISGDNASSTNKKLSLRSKNLEPPSLFQDEPPISLQRLHSFSHDTQMQYSSPAPSVEITSVSLSVPLITYPAALPLDAQSLHSVPVESSVEGVILEMQEELPEEKKQEQEENIATVVPQPEAVDNTSETVERVISPITVEVVTLSNEEPKEISTESQVGIFIDVPLSSDLTYSTDQVESSEVAEIKLT